MVSLTPKIWSAVLPLCQNGERLRVLNQLGGDNARTIRCPAVKALAMSPLVSVLQLPVSVRQVVSHSISKNALESLGLGHVLALLADDNDQLALVVETVHLLGHVRNRDGVGGTRQACGRLEEEDRVLWLGKLVFFGMVGVVEAQAADGAGVCWC